MAAHLTPPSTDDPREALPRKPITGRIVWSEESKTKPLAGADQAGICDFAPVTDSDTRRSDRYTREKEKAI
jgi:hypothetical protein